MMLKRFAVSLSLLLAFCIMLSGCAVRGAIPANPSESMDNSFDSDESVLPEESGESEPPAGYEPGEPVPPIVSFKQETGDVQADPSLLTLQDVPLGVEPSATADDKPYSIIPLSATSATPTFNLSIPTTFKVTRPEKQISTEYTHYFITGTSDPSQPLTIDGESIERLGTRGTWGVYVPLAVGNNSFVIRQGGESATVTIARRAGGVGPIKTIVQNSMYPAIQGGVKVGGNLLLECTAPSGATVVATFEGKSVTLQQQANANAGIPAVFRGSMTIDGDYPANATTKIGKIKYKLTYSGATTEYESSGDVFVAGANSYIAIRVTAYQGFIYPDTSNLSVFREKLKTGATDYVYSEDNAYYRLYSGGYVPKGQCEIIEGTVKIGNAVSTVTPHYASKREVYQFSGISRTAYYTEYKDNIFYLTLYNTSGSPSVGAGNSRLFSSISASAGDNSSITYAFNLKNTGLYWGHNVWFDGNDLYLRFQYRPSLSSDPSKPFSGITIMLDPGHGDHDPGALGVAAGVGPNENTLNLATAYNVRDKLTALGADVLMTRAQLDEYLTLDERLQAFEASGADLFLSLHHNSLGENADANKVTGTEIYYHTWTSAKSSQAILDGYCAITGSKQRESRQSYYRVTLLSSAPSMLIELGFMCNPADYERLCTTAGISRSGDGVVEGLRRAFA